MPEPQPPKPPESDNIDPLLESLLAKARPILAEERGLNHRSRVKIQSLGKQMKIPAAVIDQALQLLHGMPPIQGLGEKSAETQYERAFAKAMSKKIAAIPGKILTNKIEEKAISVGTRKYQLSETQARNIVRRVAEEVGVPRVTLTDAERHTETEISEAIGDATWVTGEVKERLIRNAKRLGVTREQVESMVQRHLQFNFKQVQFERKLTDRLWVVAACIVVGTGLSLFVFFQIKKGQKENDAFKKADEEQKTPGDPDEDILDKVVKTPDWWDDTLKLQLQKTRLKVSGFPELHDRMKSPNQVTRSRAYQELFSVGEGKVNPQVIRQRVALVIPGLYRSDPNIDALAGMLRGFEKSIKMPVGKVPTSRDFYSKAFWALELLNQMVGEESLDDAKVVAIQKLIESITGRNFDLFLSADSRLSKQKRALIEGYFKQMADIANAFPAVAPQSFEMLEELASDELSADRIQNMRTLFLTSLLKSEPESWSNSSSLIKRTIVESSSSEISFFIDLMETTAVESLQIFLEEALLARAGLGDDFDSVKELAARLREYFEIGKPVEPNEVLVSDERLVKVLDQYNTNWALTASKLDNRRSAQLLVESVYVATLLAILDTDEEEALERLINAGFPKLDDPAYLNLVLGVGSDGDSSTDIAETDRDENNKRDANQRLARQRMNEALAQLNRFQILSPERRLAALSRVHEMTTVVDQLEGGQAAILAEYLFARKNQQEREIVMRTLPDFRRWPRLFLALADVLANSSLSRQTCLDVSSQLLNEDIRLDGPSWAENLAKRLSDAAREQLKIQTSGGNSSGRPDPVGTLKSLVEYFYRLRVRAELTRQKLPAQSELQASLDFLIERHQSRLEKKGDAGLLNEFYRRKEIVAALGNDPLTRFQLKQQVLLVGRDAGLEKNVPGNSPEIMTKLQRLAGNRLPKIESVVGQIAENEVLILLNYYQQKLN